MNTSGLEFSEIIRKSNAILIRASVDGMMRTFTVNEMVQRIRMLKDTYGFSELELAQEMKAYREWKRERQRDYWPDVIEVD